MLAGAKRLTPESIKGMMRMKKPDKRIGVYEMEDNNMTFPQGIKWTRQRRAVYINEMVQKVYQSHRHMQP